MSKIYDGIMGAVVGDALGVPVEFKVRDSFNVTDMIEYGTHNQPEGTWSDDSSMLLATLDSIGQSDKIDPDDIMSRFSAWLTRGDYTAHGEVFDIGGTTQRAIQRYNTGIAPMNCGEHSINSNGNGSLMRILPLVFVPHSFKDVMNVSRLTHANEISIAACWIYLSIIDALLIGTTKLEAVTNGLKYIESTINNSKAFQRLSVIHLLKRDCIKSTGYVVDTLEAALWCFLTTNTYKECVLAAVNLGDDTDTVASIAGGIAGIYYGCGGDRGIPQKWIEKITRNVWIRDMCERIE